MRRFVIAGLATAIILLPLFGYVFLKGAEWGIGCYRQSRQFAMTLESMYHFGLIDGCLSDDMCSEAGLVDPDDGGHR